MRTAADHRADMAARADARTAAGDPVWQAHIDLHDLFAADIPYEARRDAIAARLTRHRWVVGQPAGSPVTAAVGRVAAAPDPASFDEAFALLYGLADLDGVWIQTVGPVRPAVALFEWLADPR